MKNKEELKSLVEALTSSEDYEGNYGYRVTDTSATLSNVDELDRQQAPADYLEFLTEFGFGELDAAFHLDDGPEKYSTICGREIEGYEGVYVFGGNSSDVLYAFDAKNNWQVVEISSELDGVDVLASNFSDFIFERLKYVKSLVERRAAG
ncbi:SMI1/KNR4 family protein [Pseudomonas bijieensis]|uniref:SMI1/KNR4 family protein n=1 Tax=Pseudomonas bijieensis TaxID=2681983 RepID=UPI0013A09A82|nr:SMI1/KNR4 family protein [Pseudomonas bijieensis]MCD9115878.1 SMI1/KNR4 family protein [Pseudomonas bijieensis]QIB05128.1 SMI1/KNR4 family protein [Pseudomonas fluorescens]